MTDETIFQELMTCSYWETCKLNFINVQGILNRQSVDNLFVLMELKNRFYDIAQPDEY